MATRKNLGAGLPEDEARRRARVRFGPKPLIEDQCRDSRGISLLETLWQDVRYAFRSFRRAPTFAATVIGTIALGLGLNAAFFTLFDAYVLRPLAVRDPYSLYSFTWIDAARRYHSFSWPEYQQFRDDNPTFSDVFATRKQVIARIDGRVAYGELVTGEYFRLLGVEAVLGRTLTDGDASRAGGEPVVVLSHAFWQRHFGADPLIVGTTILIRGYRCDVVGVLPDGFAGLDVLPHDFWVPLTLSPLDATAPRIPVTAIDGASPIAAAYRFASPEFFSVFDIPLRTGRRFTPAESVSGAAVAIVSQTAARRLWPSGDAIGQSLRIVTNGGKPGQPFQLHSRVEVVGIAGDIATGYGDSHSDKTAIYLPASAQDRGSVLVARVSGDTEVARRTIDAALTAVNPGSVEHIHRMQELVVGRTYPLRVAYWLSAMVGGLALLLTISGIYGLLSYMVTQRAQEMGIRIALGARAHVVTGLVLRQSLRLATVGLAIGALMAVGASRVLASRLVKMNTFDAAAFGWGILLVLITCIAAAAVPALRATRIDPAGSLRHD